MADDILEHPQVTRYTHATTDAPWMVGDWYQINDSEGRFAALPAAAAVRAAHAILGDVAAREVERSAATRGLRESR